MAVIRLTARITRRKRRNTMNIETNHEARRAFCGRVDSVVRRFVSSCPHKADCVGHGVVIPDECPDCEVFKGNAGCVWRANEDGAYETVCGNTFEFYADGPEENGFQFCPYCGNPLHA